MLGRHKCNHWESIGPSNIGGRVRAITFHPTEEGVIYLGNSQGGVYRSDDDGGTWRPMMHDELSLVIGALAVAPSNGERLYVGTGEYWGGRKTSPLSAGIGVYRSIDGGRSWELRVSTNGRYSGLVVHPGNELIAYASGDNGVERTLDGGDTWQQIRAGRASDVKLDPNGPDVLFAGFEGDAADVGGVWRADGASTTPAVGIVWTAMNTGLVLTRSHASFPDNNFIKLSATVDGRGATVLWLQMNTLVDPFPGPGNPGLGDFVPEVFRLVGNTWESRGKPGTDTTFGQWCNVIAVEPGNADVVYAGAQRFAWTNDDGGTWRSLNSGHTDNHAVAFDPNNQRRTLVGNDGGVWQATRSVNQNTWDYQEINRHHVTAQFVNVAASQEGRRIVAGATQDQGVLVSRNGTHEFDAVSGAEWGAIEIHSAGSALMVWEPHEETNPNLRRSDDAGETEDDASTGLNNRWASAIAINPEDSDIVVIGVQNKQRNGAVAILRSSDGAGPAGFTDVQALAGSRLVADIAFAPSDSARVYALHNTRVWVSASDSGQTWANFVNGPEAGRRPVSVAVDWDNPNVVYITYADTGIRHVWRGEVDIVSSTIAWTDVSGARPEVSLPDVPVLALIVDRRHADRFYVATPIGIFRSGDGGDSWTPFDEGLPNANVTGITYRTSGYRLYVSTFGRGIYERQI